MAKNFPGPLEVELFYTVTQVGLPLTHIQRLNAIPLTTPAPGDPLASFSLQTRNLGSIACSTAITNWVNLIAPAFSQADTNFTSANVWLYTPGSFERTFINGMTIGLLGTDVLSSSPAAQYVISFKTQEGGNMRLQFMEPRDVGDVVDPYPLVDGDFQAVAAFVIGATNWIVARDTSYPIIARAGMGSQNEKTFRQRYRP